MTTNYDKEREKETRRRTTGELIEVFLGFSPSYPASQGKIDSLFSLCFFFLLSFSEMTSMCSSIGPLTVASLTSPERGNPGPTTVIEGSGHSAMSSQYSFSRCGSGGWCPAASLGTSHQN